MSKPLIGVTPLYDLEKQNYTMWPEYLEAIENAGGLPCVLPFVQDAQSARELCEKFAGFLFTGGEDIQPRLYEEEQLPVCEQSCPQRDRSEQLLFEQIMLMGKPILGICRGLQMINVLMGGSLYQDIPSQLSEQVKHSQDKPYTRTVHTVNFRKGGFFQQLNGQETLAVNSLHHQGIKKLAAGLAVEATAADDLIEAFKGTEQQFLVGVQWHPEFLWQADTCNRKLFTAFIQACSSK